MKNKNLINFNLSKLYPIRFHYYQHLKNEKMKKKQKLLILIGVLIQLYLIIDIIHFFLYRKQPIYMEYAEAVYEDIPISCLKWFFSIVGLYGIYLDKNHKKSSYFFILNASLSLIILFFSKGFLNNLVKGHFLYNMGFLEICVTCLFILSNSYLANKYNILKKEKIINYFIWIIIICLMYCNGYF